MCSVCILTKSDKPEAPRTEATTCICIYEKQNKKKAAAHSQGVEGPGVFPFPSTHEPHWQRECAAYQPAHTHTRTHAHTHRHTERTHTRTHTHAHTTGTHAHTCPHRWVRWGAAALCCRRLRQRLRQDTAPASSRHHDTQPHREPARHASTQRCLHMQPHREPTTRQRANYETETQLAAGTKAHNHTHYPAAKITASPSICGQRQGTRSGKTR